MLARITVLTFMALALLATASAQPTISGTNAFWYLGPLPTGVYSDGGTCSGQSGPCYYTQSAISASPSSGSGYTWSVSYSGTGRVSLSCTSNCSNSITVTATAASSGCSADVTLYATYSGQESSGYGLTIVTPTTGTLQSGYPYDEDNPIYGTGSFLTTYNWEVSDSCGNDDTGIDQNEGFCSYPDDDDSCTWTNDYSGNNWGTPIASGGYISSVFVDYMGQNNPGGTPASSSPSSNGYDTCSTSTPVLHAPWTGYVGSQSNSCSGVDSCGAQILSNTFQYYTDCGRHQ